MIINRLPLILILAFLVPRYENAAKSNFWTMTRDGFEEFGNENSFKRRRRRGAALAPISAYKNKKYNSVSVDGDYFCQLAQSMYRLLLFIFRKCEK